MDDNSPDSIADNDSDSHQSPSTEFYHRDSVFVNQNQIKQRRISREDDDTDDDDDELNRNTKFNMKRQSSSGSSQVRFKIDDNSDNSDDDDDNDNNNVQQNKPLKHKPKPISIDNNKAGAMKLRSTLSSSTNRSTLTTPTSANKRISFAQFDHVFKFDESMTNTSTNNDKKIDEQTNETNVVDQNEDNKTYTWDSFKSIPTQDEDLSSSSNWVKFFLKLLKLLSHAICFILVLVTAVIAKLFLHLMANMTRVDKSIQICKQNLLDDSYDHSALVPLYTRLELKSNERIAWIWMLFFTLIAPDILLFFRSIHSCLFKNYSLPDLYSTLIIFLSSTFEVIGISLLVYVVLPSFDTIVGLMITNSLFLIPSLSHFIRVIKMNNNNDEQKRQTLSNLIMKILYLIAFLFQIIAIVSWPILISIKDSQYKSTTIEDNVFDPKPDDIHLTWIIPIACFLITFSYWENFLDNNDPDNENDDLSSEIKNRFLKLLYKIKNSSKRSKFAIYLFVSIWKCLLHLAIMLIIQGIFAIHYSKTTDAGDDDVDDDNNNNHHLNRMADMMNFMFANFSEAFRTHPIPLVANVGFNYRHPTIDSDPMLPISIGLIQITAAFFCYQTINFVCKICIQPLGFGLPITLAMPITVSLAHSLGQIAINDRCWLPDHWHIFDYTFFNVPYDIFDYKCWINYLFYIIWMITFISQIIITNHIWISSKERLASTNQLFMLPLYSSAFIDQSLMLNRRRNYDNDIWSTLNENELDSLNNDRKSPVQELHRKASKENDDNDIRIFACATVWHETADELLQMLKSIMRMDKDQCCRSLAVNYLGVKKRDVDFYRFETHLFVDDAFKKGKHYKKNANDLDINEYVQTLIDVLDEAAQNVHQRYLKIKQPNIHLTPYGGRIEWTLPGRTKLIAHLKDSARIRHRKRWSQVMYMYYLLGYLIYQQEPDRRDILMKNTYLLALDGDINFQPDAVLLLVDLMRKNSKLGAACGRVHPVGVGPMAWYQKFEYAISHWLQKATEHVFGCVLCSPGCFSLFRASALSDTNVMNRYTTKPSEAIHYVQYDQGEDRWLCTLLLQQGWKVEYSAASDSFTHCPEGFDDFYIQRRRWAPSTMANVIDLLKSYKNTVRANDDISSLYMLYQAGLMLGTILSPGTIFLMLVGAVNNSFGLKNEISFYINIIPVLIFVLVCFFAKNKIQILVAQLFSTFYVMLMLAVLVSTFIEIYEESIFSPSVIFFVGMFAVFVISALIHPQEISCLIPVIIYMLMIPSMYLLLTLYSIINMNIVVWGTRENPKTTEQTQQTIQPAPKQSDNLFNDVRQYFRNRSRKLEIFNCVCCGTPRNDDEFTLLHEIKNSMQQVQSDMEKVKTQNSLGSNIIRRMSLWNRRRSTIAEPSSNQSEQDPLLSDDLENEDILLNIADQVDQNKEKEDEEFLYVRQPRWIHNDHLKNADIISIDEEEKQFWTIFIEKYLKPLDKNVEHEKKVKSDLINLRNQAFFAMSIINIIFVLFVYLMQLHKDIFNFDITLSQQQNGTKTILIDDEEHDIPIYNTKKIAMDPVGFILILFFGVILIIQFIGMLLHRMGTLTHLLAFTDLHFFHVRAEDIKEKRQLDQNAFQLVQSIMDDTEESDTKDYGYFDMEDFFRPSMYRVMDPSNAYEMIKKIKPNTNVSKRKLGAELSRRSSIFVGRSHFYTDVIPENDENPDHDGDDNDGNHHSKENVSDSDSNESTTDHIFSRESSPIRKHAPLVFTESTKL
ncbi:chitin synthase I [Dermatophagoides pteronyssinus]|uniref:chitin synthase n=1 Tax=Dermatophagoides pteronyssinus TaxID=6956 RepID=A0ABQ8JWN9_DERPT|nr:chitin synthase I [Dermatophagoides pteronyssinus]